MARDAARTLRDLERIAHRFGESLGDRKVELLRILARGRLTSARAVLRLHEVLCFLRAHPDSRPLLDLVDSMLRSFARRGDLRRFREELQSSGIAGTDIHFAFYPWTASWLVSRWGAQLTIDWDQFDKSESLEELLPQLAHFAETPGLDEFDWGVASWIDRMKGPGETDAAFLLKRLDQVRLSAMGRETLLEGLDIPFVLTPGPGTPSRTAEWLAGSDVVFRTSPLDRSRRPITGGSRGVTPIVRTLRLPEAKSVIDLARATMVTRHRDLDAFSYANPRDVRMVDCGAGIQVAYIGVIPVRRFLLESLYGFLVILNGVPVGYGTLTVLFGSSEVAFTIFETFRAGEGALLYSHIIAHARQFFGCDAFTIDSYQIGGYENEDAIQSGAWWFYRKLGFEPGSSPLRALMNREESRMRAKPSYRSGAPVLRKLAEENLFLYLGRHRKDVIGRLPLPRVGLRITEYLAGRFGFDRQKAESVCAREAAVRLDEPAWKTWSPGERLAWRRWGPVVLVLPGLDRWSPTERKGLVAVIRSKGGRRESEYLKLFDGHRKLRRAIRRLVERESSL